MLVGAAAGGHDPFQPLRGAALPGFGGRGLGGSARSRCRSGRSPRSRTSTASSRRPRLPASPAMLDFYADWCVSCKEMEKYTFSVPDVQQDLAGFVLLKADVTANNEADQALLRRFGVYGPPTTAFFGAEGRECRAFRLVGFVEADEFRVASRALRARMLNMGRPRPLDPRPALALAAGVAAYLREPRLARAGDRHRPPLHADPRGRDPGAPARRDARRPGRQAAHAFRMGRQAADHQFLGDLVRALPARDPDAERARPRTGARRVRAHRHRHRLPRGRADVPGRRRRSTTRC